MRVWNRRSQDPQVGFRYCLMWRARRIQLSSLAAKAELSYLGFCSRPETNLQSYGLYKEFFGKKTILLPTHLDPTRCAVPRLALPPRVGLMRKAPQWEMLLILKAKNKTSPNHWCTVARFCLKLGKKSTSCKIKMTVRHIKTFYRDDHKSCHLNTLKKMFVIMATQIHYWASLLKSSLSNSLEEQTQLSLASLEDTPRQVIVCPLPKVQDFQSDVFHWFLD